MVLADNLGVVCNAVYGELFVTYVKDVLERIQQQSRQHGVGILNTLTSTIRIR